MKLNLILSFFLCASLAGATSISLPSVNSWAFDFSNITCSTVGGSGCADIVTSAANIQAPATTWDSLVFTALNGFTSTASSVVLTYTVTPNLPWQSYTTTFAIMNGPSYWGEQVYSGSFSVTGPPVIGDSNSVQVTDTFYFAPNANASTGGTLDGEVSTPEPLSIALFGIGLLALVFGTRRFNLRFVSQA